MRIAHHRPPGFGAARAFRIGCNVRMHFTVGNPLLPIASLVAGVFLTVAPRIVSFAVAVYLIFVGLFRLNGIYHFVN